MKLYIVIYMSEMMMKKAKIYLKKLQCAVWKSKRMQNLVVESVIELAVYFIYLYIKI